MTDGTDKAKPYKSPDKDKPEPRRPGGKTKRNAWKRSTSKKMIKKAAKK